MEKTKRFLIALLSLFSVMTMQAQVAIPKGSEDFKDDTFGYVWASDTENIVRVCNYQKRAVTAVVELNIPGTVYCESEGVECVVVGVSDGAFSNLLNLENVILPSTIKEIGAGAFTHVATTDDGSLFYSGLSKLTSINLDNVERIGANAFRASNLSSLTLSSTLKEVGANAFAECPSLESVMLETSAQLASSVFSGCSNLVTVEFGSSVTSIADGLFANTSIAEVSFPATLLNIGARAFQDTKVKNVNIPASVTEVKALAFDGCNLLENVYFLSNPKIADTAFPSTASLNLALKDKEDFTNVNENEFDNITYSREFTEGKFASLILPFVPDQFGTGELEVYKLSTGDENTLVFKEVEEFVPGTPYFVRATQNIDALTGTDKNAKLAKSEQNNVVSAGDWEMIGQYERIVLSAADGASKGCKYYYYSTADECFYFSEGKLGVSPFRTYIKASVAAPAQMRMMVRRANGVETEIDMVELEDVLAPAVDAYYDLTGRRVLAPVEGQMYIVNGKKVIY